MFAIVWCLHLWCLCCYFEHVDSLITCLVTFPPIWTALFFHNFFQAVFLVSSPFFCLSRVFSSADRTKHAVTMWHGVSSFHLREDHQREHGQHWLWWLFQVWHTPRDIQRSIQKLIEKKTTLLYSCICVVFYIFFTNYKGHV